MDIQDDDDERPEIYDFGWWPEIFGAIGTALLIGGLMVFARGNI